MPTTKIQKIIKKYDEAGVRFHFPLPEDMDEDSLQRIYHDKFEGQCTHGEHTELDCCAPLLSYWKDRKLKVQCSWGNVHWLDEEDLATVQDLCPCGHENSYEGIRCFGCPRK